MDFDRLLDQAIEMLQRRGRLTYRTLKRQFELDDDTLEDLKLELIEGQQIATDEKGSVLVWTGEKELMPDSTSEPSTPRAAIQSDQLPQSEPQPVVEQTKPAHVETPPVEPRVPDAERRQLTVMFCDLVDSTRLSGQLDPEDLRDVIRAYQATCNEVIQRFDGYVAQHLGDGLLIYFGYPAAHEDDTQRAVRTALGIIEAMRALNQRLAQSHNIQLAVRMGIHTGLVVIGDIGAGERREQLALGETPNVAARIQGLAEPDTVVISNATYRLVEGYFECDTLGERVLKGVDDPLTVYHVLSERGDQDRLEVVLTHGLTPLVGRASEVSLLLERWGQVKNGQGQVVLLVGEAGIGKSRLTQVLRERITAEPYARLECRSSPYYTNTALYPVIDSLQRTLRIQASDAPEERLEKLEMLLRQYQLPLNDTVPLLAALLSIPVPEDRYDPLNLTPQLQRQRTLETVLAVLLELADQQPLLFILEDLHWTDPTTLEFLELLLDQTPTVSICVLLTCRPEFQPSWSHRSYLTEMTLNRLSHSQIEQVATQVAGGKTLPVEIIQQLADKTDGVPLYVEEIAKAVLESGVLKEMDKRYELTGAMGSLTIPATLQDSLMARLDRLVTAKAVAQYASVIGRQFSYELLQAVVELDEAALQQELGKLVEAELIYQRGLPPQSTYRFKHALIQDTAYESLLRRTRRQHHQHIAHVLAERFPEVAEMQPELLAHHYTEAGFNEQAVHYWQRAGQRSLERLANREAIGHLTKGLEVLATLPDTCERAQQELILQTTLGPALMAVKGRAAPEIGRVYSRARQLCQQVGETVKLFPVLQGLAVFHMNRAELQTAWEVGEQLLELAQHQPDPALLLQIHRTLGVTLLWLGEITCARSHLEKSIVLYDLQQHRSLAFLYGRDPKVDSLCYTALALWLLGYPDQALERISEALTLARARSHPYSLALALIFATRLRQYRREVQGVQEWAEAALSLSTEQRFPVFVAVGTLLGGWAIAMQGAGEQGVARMHQGLVAYQATTAELQRPWYLALLAEAYGKRGQAEAGLGLLAETLTTLHSSAECVHEAEVYRLQGELLLTLPEDNRAEAEICFHQALDIARRQQAKSWELRVATNLARLWQSQGKCQDAYNLLAPVYNWFTEGFDTADLIDAKVLLDELGR